jgi:hypothetical protein
MADKYLYNNGGKITERELKDSSAGAGDAGKGIALDSTGKLSSTMLPPGVVPEFDQIACSENLSAGDFVNTWISSGVKCRKADGSTSGKEADGFVLAAYTSGQTANVYKLSQLNNQKSAMTPGAVQYLSVTVPGGTQETVPTGTGQVIQKLGKARSASELIFSPDDPIVLA